MHDAGFVARCALEVEDGSEIRLDKIRNLIAECRFSILDISRIEPDENSGLPRFNMPFEFGLAMGCKYFGGFKSMSALVLDTERYRYQKFLSDIAGQDIRAHGGQPKRAIEHVRNWLQSNQKRAAMPGADAIWTRYLTFRKALPALCKRAKLTQDKLTFTDFSLLVTLWIKAAGA